MVDSTKGISNLHAPNDVIVDASMPAMIRAGGKMYGPDGKLKDTKAVMPESTFARIYQEMINFCKTHGAFDPATMGSLGVRSQGGGSVNLVMNVTTPDVQGFERSRSQIAAQMSRALARGNRNR